MLIAWWVAALISPNGAVPLGTCLSPKSLRAEFYDHDTAKWFMDAHGNALLSEDGFHVREGFNVLVMVEANNLPSN